MEVPELEGTQKSFTLAEVDSEGSVTPAEKLEIEDGDGGMSEFTDAPSFEEAESEVETDTTASSSTQLGTDEEASTKAPSSDPTETPAKSTGESSQVSSATTGEPKEEVSSAVVRGLSVGALLSFFTGHLL